MINNTSLRWKKTSKEEVKTTSPWKVGVVERSMLSLFYQLIIPSPQLIRSTKRCVLLMKGPDQAASRLTRVSPWFWPRRPFVRPCFRPSLQHIIITNLSTDKTVSTRLFSFSLFLMGTRKGLWHRRAKDRAPSKTGSLTPDIRRLLFVANQPATDRRKRNILFQQRPFI